MFILLLSLASERRASANITLQLAAIFKSTTLGGEA